MKFVFLLGIFLLPLIFWPWAEIAYEIPRVWFFQRWMEVLGILGLVVFVLQRKKRGGKKNGLIFLVFFFIFVVLFVSFFGVDLTKSLWGNYYRGDGLLTLLHLGAFFFWLNLFWDNSWVRVTALALAGGCFLTSIATIFLGFKFHFLGDLNVERFGRAIGGPFGQPNFLAGYLLVCLPFIGFLMKKAKSNLEKLFWFLVLFSQFGSIGLTLSRAGILGIFIFVAFWLAINRGVKLKTIVKLLAVLVFLSFLLPFLKDQRDPGGYYIAENRARIFAKGFLAFWQKPILGWGWANFDYAFEAIDWPEKFAFDVYVDKAHCQLLEVLVTTGLVGLIVYLAIIRRSIKTLLTIMPRSREAALWWQTVFLSLVLYLFHSQTNVISIGEEVIFWLCLGIASHYPRAKKAMGLV